MYQWDGVLMEPIFVEWGVKLVGKHSINLYKDINNGQLETAQDSKLGVDLGGKAVFGGEASPDDETDLIIFAIDQADDLALVSNDIFVLHTLLLLSTK